jgi:gliding motility-associated-like protein
MRLRKVLPLIIIFGVLTGKVSGQIFSPAANDSFAAVYNLPDGTDKVFIYNQIEYKGNRIASIRAVSTDRLTGWNFQWAVYDQNSQLYSSLPGSSSGWFSDIDTITVSSGYQVTMSKGSSTFIYRVWLVFNDFQVEITNKDADNKLQFGYYNCSSLDLRADTNLIQRFYFNPDTKAKINVYSNYTIRWKTDNNEASIPPSRLITRVSSPPSEDTWYILKVTDRFNLVRSDSVFYSSIQSDAKMTGVYVNLGDSLEYSGHHYGWYYNDNIKSAPGKYRFDVSSSKNAVSYKIDFGDGETLESDTGKTEIVHEFKKPGKYKVVLTTKSDKPYECTDSVTVDADLVYGDFSLPNVFSPNNDGENDQMNFYDNNNVFRSDDVSVVTIDIAIFDRAGRKVHAFAGNIRDWSGWDGRVMHSNRDAPEGVYYYAISALVYFKSTTNPIKNGVYKGFFHLYRP